MAARDQTRTLITRELGFELQETGDGYREPSGEQLDGDWLGAFAQPSVVLNKVTPMSLAIAGASGRSVDEYGEATLEIARGRRDRIEITKRYVGRGVTGHFQYIGRLEGGSLAGYWYSLARPEFAGVFWYGRAERLAQPGADRLRASVQKRSRKKRLLVGALLATAIAARIYPPVVLGAFAIIAPGAYVLHRRTVALRRDVDAWRAEL